MLLHLLEFGYQIGLFSACLEQHQELCKDVVLGLIAFEFLRGSLFGFEDLFVDGEGLPHGLL
jgi:hypothetical protein